MDHATVAYLFHRCHNYRVVARITNETTKDPVTGKLERKVNQVKNKLGDIVLVDCNVKGSDDGTPSDPKFALCTLWDAVILPAYDALTSGGGFNCHTPGRQCSPPHPSVHSIRIC
jgi:hypothetical protein